MELEALEPSQPKKSSAAPRRSKADAAAQELAAASQLVSNMDKAIQGNAFHGGDFSSLLNLPMELVCIVAHCVPLADMARVAATCTELRDETKESLRFAWEAEVERRLRAGERVGNALIEGTGGALCVPDGVIVIGDEAFHKCPALRSISLPDSVTTIGANAFSECTALGSVRIPDATTSIGKLAFQGCVSLASVRLPASLTSIGGCAFFGCSSLTNIDMPPQNARVCYHAFYGCISLDPRFKAVIRERASDAV